MYSSPNQRLFFSHPVMSDFLWPHALSRFVIAFLPKKNVFWFHSFSYHLRGLEPKKRESVMTSTFHPSISHEVIGLDAMIFSSVQLLSRVRLFATTWTAARQASLSIINSWSLLKLLSFESVMPSNHLILCRPLLFPPSIFPSIRVFFKWISSLHQVAKVLEFQPQQWIVRTGSSHFL